MDLLVGIDVGTSACKAAVVDADGRELAHGRAPTPWQRLPTGAEIDPEALFGAAVEAARAAMPPPRTAGCEASAWPVWARPGCCWTPRSA